MVGNLATFPEKTLCHDLQPSPIKCDYPLCIQNYLWPVTVPGCLSGQSTARKPGNPGQPHKCCSSPSTVTLQLHYNMECRMTQYIGRFGNSATIEVQAVAAIQAGNPKGLGTLLTAAEVWISLCCVP
jgi:hypothetical protein